MSEIDNPKALFESSCSTNSEPYALQNIGDMMTPEFSENSIIIVDPGMPIHHCVVQQKQRKQKSLHYYFLDKDSKEMVFSSKGKVKDSER